MSRWLIEPLAKRHSGGAFDCGVDRASPTRMGIRQEVFVVARTAVAGSLLGLSQAYEL